MLNQPAQTIYSFYVSYYWDYGVEALPVAGPVGTPCEIVATCAPTCYKAVNFLAQAADSGDPQPPDWNTASPNEVLKQKAVSSTFLAALSDGTTAKTIAGVYIYLLLVPPADTDDLAIGQPPYDSTLNNVLIPSDFIKGLLGPSGMPTGQGPYAGVTATGLNTSAANALS